MSNTYTQLYIQLVFAVKGRKSFIQQTWEQDLYRYITAVVQNDKHKLQAINGMPDHIHIFLGLNPSIAISDLVKDIKRATHNWINDKGFVKERFEWQSGYGAFSYSKSQASGVIAYVHNQETHHRKISFLEEYKKFPEKFEVPYDERYIFKAPE